MSKEEITSIVLNCIKSELNYRYNSSDREMLEEQKNGYIRAMLDIFYACFIDENLIWQEVNNAKQEII